ncbi:hypothetical protein [Escherichia phage vB_EcoP_EcoN5]|uniref:Uncharacterized protein n=1 Tax=Escherichia phage vB_EcoP_EcoN5 TaxID=2686238 RepID=A0A7L4XU17_9CAUD|nr:hypothetical protein PQC47_gp066 [Escherichia phage vB_EcoP_EcoN5]QGZ13766.1 hypothetical protein [Escherichia phage vB_EcoP_EcoN5]
MRPITMRQFWLAKIKWASGGMTMTALPTRQQARDFKKSMFNMDMIKNISIHKAREYSSGRVYIGGKVHY